MMRLILFDIDGTLISAGGAGTRSMNLAFRDLFGVRNAFEGIPMAGKTDIQIMKEGLMTHGISLNNGHLQSLMDCYVEILRREIDNPERTLHPGVKSALDLFQSLQYPLGLLTGNLEQGARIKLGAFGIDTCFIDGAYGSDDEDRDRLLPVAVKKFQRHGYHFAPHECVVIGDTPRDVQCAKIHGAFCIAVATGPYSKDILQNTDADVIIDSLEGIQDALRVMSSSSG